MKQLYKTLGALLIALGVASVLASPAAAQAHGPGPYVGEVAAGGACTQAQAAAHARGSHDGRPYECRQVPGADGRPCWVWKRVVVAGEPTGRWSGSPAACARCLSSPPVSATPTRVPSTPAPSMSSSRVPPVSAPPVSPPASSPSTAAPVPSVSAAVPAAGGHLPVTGPSGWLLALGAVSLLGGVSLLLAGRRRVA